MTGAAKILSLGAFVGALLGLTVSPANSQTRLTQVRTAYSALSAGIDTLWLTHEEGHFKNHGPDSNLIYIRGGTTAVQARSVRPRSRHATTPATAHNTTANASRISWRW